MQLNSIRHNSIKFYYDAFQCNVIQHNSMLFNSMQFNSIQWNSIQSNLMQFKLDAIQFNLMQFKLAAIQFNMTQSMLESAIVHLTIFKNDLLIVANFCLGSECTCYMLSAVPMAYNDSVDFCNSQNATNEFTVREIREVVNQFFGRLQSDLDILWISISK